MNTTSMIVGAAVFSFGLYIAILRGTRPQKLSKLQALKDLFGDRTGDKIHLLAYAVMPLLTGAILLFAGTRGISLF